MNWEQLLRENIRALQPYRSAREEHGMDDGIFLDANENGLGSIGTDALNRYPDPLQIAVKQKLAGLKNIAVNHIFLGNGSDEAIDLLIRAFCEPGSGRILITTPSYGMYKVCAEINSVAVDQVLLNSDFSLNGPAVLNAIRPETKLIFLCSPNNPTGNLLQKETVENILRQFTGLVVIDEAYVDFAETQSWLYQQNKFPNLVVLQTFSKAWGLAGIRLGMAYGAAPLIHILNKIKYPYNVNQLTQQTALRAIKDSAKLKKMVKTIIDERKNLAGQLKVLPFITEVFPSDANFLLFRSHDANALYHFLRDAGILIRNRSNLPLCTNCLRVSVGTAEENAALLKAMENFTQK